MIHTVYVTEPDLIDLSIVTAKLPQESFLVVGGSSSFEQSKQYPYDTLLIRSGTKVTDQIKTFFPDLKHVVRVGTGLDNVDLDFCKREGIAVYNAAGANADAVAEYVVSVILVALRKLHQRTQQDVLDWNRLKFLGSSMNEQTVGLIGFGNVGRLLHKKLSGFELKGFLIYDPYIDTANVPEDVKKVETIDELIQLSTIVSLHIPLTDETKNIIGNDRLALLNKDAVLINSSRGGIVDESAVLDLLNDGSPFTYIADTVENEPHGNPALFNNDNIIVTPHIASLTDSANRQMLETALDNLLNSKSV
jgi:phosphoglycerate dehydrogenase-like enzyme